MLATTRTLTDVLHAKYANLSRTACVAGAESADRIFRARGEPAEIRLTELDLAALIATSVDQTLRAMIAKETV